MFDAIREVVVEVVEAKEIPDVLTTYLEEKYGKFDMEGEHDHHE